MANPFDKYKVEGKVYFIKSLGSEVTLRELTYGESEEFMKAAVKGEDAEGNPIMDLDAIAKALVAKVSLALLEPKMTVKQLTALGASSRSSLVEISKIVEGIDLVDDSGKSDSQTEISST